MDKKQKLPGFVYLPRKTIYTSGSYFKIKNIEQIDDRSITTNGHEYGIPLTMEEIAQAILDAQNNCNNGE